MRNSIVLLILFSQACLAYEGESWSYSKDRDKFDDTEYSYARSGSINYQYNDYFNIGFGCEHGKVWFDVSTGSFIQSKNGYFQFEYRVDKNPSRMIEMRTYSNNSQRGYSYENAKAVIKDILGGHTIFVRAITWDNDYLQTELNLKASDKNIKKYLLIAA